MVLVFILLTTSRPSPSSKNLCGSFTLVLTTGVVHKKTYKKIIGTPKMDQKSTKNLEESYEIVLDTTGTPEPKRPYSFYDDEYFHPKKNPSKKAEKENPPKKKSRRHKHDTAPYSSDSDFSSSEELSNEDTHPGNDSRYVWEYGYDPVFRPAKIKSSGIIPREAISNLATTVSTVG